MSNPLSGLRSLPKGTNGESKVFTYCPPFVYFVKLHNQLDWIAFNSLLYERLVGDMIRISFGSVYAA